MTPPQSTPNPPGGHGYVLVNARTGTRLAQEVEVVRAGWLRTLRLLGRRWLDPGRATRFLPGRSAPTRRLPADLLLLNRDGVVLHTVHSLPPLDAAWGDPVHSVVELPAGTLTLLDTGPGDLVEMHRAEGAQNS